MFGVGGGIKFRFAGNECDLEFDRICTGSYFDNFARHFREFQTARSGPGDFRFVAAGFQIGHDRAMVISLRAASRSALLNSL